MFKDAILVGTIAGLATNLLKNSLAWIWCRLHLLDYFTSDFAASLFIKPNAIQTLSGQIIGLAADFIVSAILGISFVYLIKYSGQRFLLIKGLVYGAVVWLLLYGGVRSLPMVRLHDYNPLHIVIALINHLIFGLILSFIIKLLLGKPSANNLDHDD